jgi:hypothetical protein
LIRAVSLLDGSRQVPISRKEQRQQQRAGEHEVSEDRHGRPIAKEGLNFDRPDRGRPLAATRLRI